jgi:hypothetical protein
LWETRFVERRTGLHLLFDDRVLARSTIGAAFDEAA